MASDPFRIVPNGIHPLLLGIDSNHVIRVMGTQPMVLSSRLGNEEVLHFEYASTLVAIFQFVEQSSRKRTVLANF